MRRLNFRTFSVVPCERNPKCTNFQPVENSSSTVVIGPKETKRSVAQLTWVECYVFPFFSNFMQVFSAISSVLLDM